MDPARKASAEFSNHTEAVSAEDCAKQCFQRGCAVAGFAPPIESHSAIGSCLMSFGGDDCTSGISVTSYNATNGPVQIQCVKCGANSSPPTEITSAPGLLQCNEACVMQICIFHCCLAEACSSLISFNFASPRVEVVTHFSNIAITPSSVECASFCYKQSCSLAGYIPINSTSGNCMLSFDNNTDNCIPTNVTDRTTNYTGNEPVIFTCLRCGMWSF